MTALITAYSTAFNKYFYAKITLRQKAWLLRHILREPRLAEALERE